MNSHEFAKLLLNSENKPLFIKERYESQGESRTGYSNIKGVLFDVVENGLVIDVDYLKAEPNDKKYHKGDAIVSFIDDNKELIKLNLNIDDIFYMLIEKGTHYHSWHIDYIGFYDNPDDEDFKKLEPSIEIAISSGFHPEWKSMDLESAEKWYLNNFPEKKYEE